MPSSWCSLLPVYSSLNRYQNYNGVFGCVFSDREDENMGLKFECIFALKKKNQQTMGSKCALTMDAAH